MRKIYALAAVCLIITCLFMLVACNKNSDGTDVAQETVVASDVDLSVLELEESDYQESTEGDCQIEYSASGVTSSSTFMCAVSGATATINKAGSYIVSGSSGNGSLIINETVGADDVRIIFAGLSLTSSDGSALFVKQAKKVIITLKEGTINVLSDTSNYTLDSEGEPDATIFSKQDLTVNGKGSLTLNANYNNALHCKDTLKIIGTSVTANSVDDGIIGKDYAYFENSAVNLVCGGDGIRATNDNGTDGSIVVDGGVFNITAGADGLQAACAIAVSGGEFTVVTGGGSSKSLAADASAKGIKATGNITAEGGAFSLNCADDGVHSNASCSLKDGSYAISTGDDGVHADSDLVISDCETTVSKSYEGLEGVTVTLAGGKYNLVSSDDGINCAGGDGSSGGDTFAPPGKNHGGGLFTRGYTAEAASATEQLVLKDGEKSALYLYINAGGDGLDSNGNIYMCGGTVLVDGPTNNGNGAIDIGDGSGYIFKMTGGLLLAVGSSGMAVNISSGSTIFSIFKNVSGQSGKLLHIANGSETLLNYIPAKSYSNIVFACPELVKGNSYTINIGGTISGDPVFGKLYPNDAAYQAGSTSVTATAS